MDVFTGRDSIDELLDRLGRAVTAGREHGMLVIHVVISFRDGYPEVSERNASFASAPAAGRLRASDPANAVHPTLGPEPGDIVVRKLRVSAFTGSDLEVILRARGIETLVLAGFATSGVVLSTLREAADRDYRLVVLSDGCADRDDEVHRVLLEKVFPMQAEVVTTDDWISSLAT